MASSWKVIGLLLVCGCSSEGSVDVLVDLQTDLRPGEEFTGIRVDLFRLRDVGGVSRLGERLRRVSATGGPADDFFTGQRVAELADLERGEYSIAIALTSVDGTVVAERAVWFALQETTGVLVVITRDCRGVACPEEQTCVAGRCGDPRCVDGAQAACAAPECTARASCPAPPGCGDAVCVDGWCLLRPDDSVCASGQYCVPEIGCVDSAMPDGGVDAGPVDAGFDGGPDAGPQDGGRADGGPIDGGCMEGTVCGMPVTTLGTCSFGTTCTTMGSQSRRVETPTCMGGSCEIVITTDSVGCTRGSTDGTSCGTTNTTDGPCMFSGACTTSGTLTRTVESLACMGGSCVVGTMMSSVSCTRGSTDGTTCGTTTTSDSACTRTDPCGTAGTFVRTTTTRTCSGGTCGSTPSTMTRACTLSAVPDSTTCSGGYCCSGACVPRNHVNHCGVCGMNCASEGQTCVNATSNNGGRHDLSPPQYVCTCFGFAACRNVGYGPDSTCFDGHCQCQCPASGPTTCTGQCRTGTCFEDTIEPQSDNFCGY